MLIFYLCIVVFFISITSGVKLILDYKSAHKYKIESFDLDADKSAVLADLRKQYPHTYIRETNVTM